MLWEQGVEGSNPFAPTVENKRMIRSSHPLFCFETEFCVFLSDNDSGEQGHIASVASAIP